MADSAAAAEVLRSQRDIKRVLDAARAAEVALLGIGNLDPTQSGFVKGGFMTAEELLGLTAAGAVGDIAGRIFTAQGDLHASSYDQRTIGVDFAELKQIPKTIVVALGPEKIRAICGALHTGIVKVFCTDDRTASAVLAMEQENGK